jgi:hypothetical protein
VVEIEAGLPDLARGSVPPVAEVGEECPVGEGEGILNPA